MLRYSSSFRACTIAETLPHARRIGRDVGITRVTDTTRLDRVGVPVFASIRPGAARGSLCVSAGKGMRPEEAEIGAYMEAIELAFAEPERAGVEIFAGTARDVLDGAIDEFAPWGGKRIPADAPLDCVAAADIRTGERVVVPAEVAVYPLAQPIHGRLYFGSDGNGICSGNSLDEATVHGLTEVIERDVTSFINVKDTSILVASNASLPPAIFELVTRLDREGFDLWLRYLPNAFGLPAFMVIVRERDVIEGIHYGYGCHLSSSIALVRAVTEAMQCRLSAIHGGRDDLYRVFEPRSRMSMQDKLAYLERNARAAASQASGVIDFAAIPDAGANVTTIEDALALLLRKLDDQGLPRALRVPLGPADLPVRVVRVIVPGMEVYAHGIQRMGRRLRAALAVSGRPELSSAERAR